MRLLHNSSEVERTILPYLSSISCKFPVSLFHEMARILRADTYHQATLSPYYNKFFIRSHDLRVTKLEKLYILRSILNADNHQVLLKEFIVRVSSITQRFWLKESALRRGSGRYFSRTFDPRNRTLCQHRAGMHPTGPQRNDDPYTEQARLVNVSRMHHSLYLEP